MQVVNYRKPKSSFLSLEKDLGLIVDLILKNNNLKKLLHYTTPDALEKPNLTEEESIALINKNIKIIPKILVDEEALNYLVISFDGFAPNGRNPKFRDNVIMFDIICHVDQWNLGDFKLRPYKIAGELDSMLNNAKLTGIGELLFVSGNALTLNSEFSGITLMYEAIHGEEDKINTANPNDQAAMIENFNNIWKK